MEKVFYTLLMVKSTKEAFKIIFFMAMEDIYELKEIFMRENSNKMLLMAKERC